MRLGPAAGYVFGFAADFRKPHAGVDYADIRRVLYPGSSGSAGGAPGAPGAG